MKNKKAVDQATATEPLYNDSLSKSYYTTFLGILLVFKEFLYERKNL